MDPNRQPDELSPAPWVKEQAATPPPRPSRVGLASGVVLLAFGVLGVFLTWIWADGPTSSLAIPPLPKPITLIPMPDDVPKIPEGEHVVDVRSRKALAKGEMLMDMGRHAEALPHLRTAVRIDPDFSHARYRLGLALVMTGDVEGARQQRAALAESDPSLGNLLGNLIR